MGIISILNYIEEQRTDAFLKERLRDTVGGYFAMGNNLLVTGSSSSVAGFRFLTFQLVGQLKVHTFKGCRIVFKSTPEVLEVESDTVEIKTDYSKKLDIGITTFDLDLDASLENMIRNKTFTEIEVIIDSRSYLFQVTNFDLLLRIIDHVDEGDGEEEMDLGGQNVI